ncbi:MAG: TetR/AcrR family transcriptional regulator [Treponema sp.]|nr:TetR/AcrR family transcriptional regulator [Treponema sp.]
MENENSKEVIIKNAISLFAKKGYEGVGVQEICQQSGITKPTLYYFFKNKEGLLQAIADSKGQELFSVLQEASIYKHDFIKSLTDILTAEITFASGNPDFFNLHIVLLNAPAASEEKAVYCGLENKINQLFLDFFKKSSAEFGNMAGKESLYSKLFHNNVLAIALSSANGKMIPDDQILYQIIHSFVYGVAN